MTIKQISTVIGGLFVGAVVALLVLWPARIPVTAFGTVNLSPTILLVGFVGPIGLALLKGGLLAYA